jgi:hypothetical protein
MVTKLDRETVWRERVALWQASGLSQRAYALQNGYPVRQVGYWVRRLGGAGKQVTPALMPVRVAPSVAAPGAISLRSAQGWTLTLPDDVSALWVAELMRAL